MPKQESVVKIKGSVDDLTYYQTKHGHMIRKRGRFDKERLENDPKYARVRENMQEFGHAGKAGKLIRNAHRLMIKASKDGSMVARMQKLIVQVLKTDTQSPRGQRNVQYANLGFFEGFEFNIEAEVGKSLGMGYAVVIDRATGEVKIELPEFVPDRDLEFPPAATHFRLRTGVSELNFETNLSISAEEEMAWTAIDAVPLPAMDLVVNLTQNTVEHIFTLLSVEFAQEVNGQMYPLTTGAFNALAIVDVDSV